ADGRDGGTEPPVVPARTHAQLGQLEQRARNVVRRQTQLRRDADDLLLRELLIRVRVAQRQLRGTPDHLLEVATRDRAARARSVGRFACCGRALPILFRVRHRSTSPPVGRRGSDACYATSTITAMPWPPPMQAAPRP